MEAITLVVVEEEELSWMEMTTQLVRVLVRVLDMEEVERVLTILPIFVMDMKGLFCWKS